ncbi:hypothetical protein [Stappia sp.]|uniref:hypothetical protein n=1 Tax=Stappia sp. TaxID=1870903 RepID=UPI0032D8F19E
MMDHPLSLPPARAVLAVTLALAVAGCGAVGGIGDETAKTVISGNAATRSAVDVDPEVFRQDVPCPALEVEDGRYIVMVYERGREDDPRALRYQATVEKWANRCSRTASGVAMTLGVSGRATPGPAWGGGELVLPLRLTLEPTGDGKPQTINLPVPVTLGEGAPAEQWAVVEEGIAVSDSGSVRAVIALDESRRGRR